jgi:predicted Fe-Mo cluster-binding NifX family protein
MKIAIPIDGDNLDSMINHSFGRTKKFLVADSETMKYELSDNTQNLNAAQGAGIQSAQNVGETGAQAVITLHLGPKAFKVLSGAGIKIYTGTKATARENIEAYKRGELKIMADANMESHWV